ncbi:MAG: hypothetical protein WC044_00880 [Crocinitomicaceae bacterium]
MSGVNSPLPNEDELNLVLSVVTVSEAARAVTDGQNLVRLNNASFDVDVQTISKSELELLYDEVAGYATADKKCLTALRINYGAEMIGADIVMKLYYQPIFLSFSSFDVSTYSYLYNETQAGSLYYFENDVFVQTNSVDMKNAMDLFKANFTAKHTPEAANFTGFVEGEDVAGISIPFQTIFAELNDNDNTELVLKNGVTVLKNVAAFSVKQIILFFSTEINARGQFAGKFANRSIWNPSGTMYYGFDLL